MRSKPPPLLCDDSLAGRVYAEEHSLVADDHFRTLFHDAQLSTDHFSLVAVGGYGRRELSPYSDLDVLLIHAPDTNPESAAASLWHPIWDAGLTLGFSVGSPQDIGELIRESFEWFTSTLTARLVAGNKQLFSSFIGLRDARWSGSEPEFIDKLIAANEERHTRNGDVAFLIEPNIKLGRGGLTDTQSLAWANQVIPGFATDLVAQLQQSYDNLLRIRVELHRHNEAADDTLRFDSQDAVADVLYAGSSLTLMEEVAKAGRQIAWHTQEAWRRSNPSSPTMAATVPKSPRLVTQGKPVFEISDGCLAIGPHIDVSSNPRLALSLACRAAELKMTMNRGSLAELESAMPPMPSPWNSEDRGNLVKLFLAGRHSLRIIEDLDAYDLMSRIIPEWKSVRCLPQRNALHQFTVDRHLCEAAIIAGTLADSVDRPDLLVVGALLHDIGKGFPGDHTEVGMVVIAEIAERMGFSEDDSLVLVDLCQQHLLLSDISTRRDLTDPGTVTLVGAAVQNTEFLHLLAALSEADARATGPSAWSPWKEHLMSDLVARTERYLLGTYHDAVFEITEQFPHTDVIEALAAGESLVRVRDNTVTVTQPDCPQLFGIVAGVLAVSGLPVLMGSITTQPTTSLDKDTASACEFVVGRPPWGAIAWDEVISLLDQALMGKLAIDARLNRKVAQQARLRKRLSAEPPRREIHVDNITSGSSSIIEVYSHVGIGMLYMLTQAIDGMNLVISHAKVQTFGSQMVTTFYIQDDSQRKVFDSSRLSSLRAMINDLIKSWGVAKITKA